MTNGIFYDRIIMLLIVILLQFGEVSEWFKELVLKTSDPARDRGFESHPLRHFYYIVFAAVEKFKPLLLFLCPHFVFTPINTKTLPPIQPNRREFYIIPL